MMYWPRAVILGLALLLLTACGADEPDSEALERSEQTRQIMGEIFSGIRVVLPAAADGKRLAASASQAEVAAALDGLAEYASVLRQHVDSGDGQMQFIANSLVHDAREARRAYAEGRFDQAAFQLRQITENCIVCHTRLPSRGDSPLSAGFIAGEVLRDLPPAPRASLQMATRQFDEARTTLESLMASSETPATLLGPLTDYLVVTLRVQGNYDRPVVVLQRFAERADLWERLRLDVKVWIDALPELAQRAAAEPNLAAARALIEEGHATNPLAGGHAGLAHYVVASGMLERLIEAGKELPDRDLAEAYYLLGITEARIGRNYWVTSAPFLLETAIRLAPAEPFAQEAYALLEYETLQSYQGSDFEKIPEADAARLRELSGLIGQE
jgi:hypothetical protein